MGLIRRCVGEIWRRVWRSVLSVFLFLFLFLGMELWSESERYLQLIRVGDLRFRSLASDPGFFVGSSYCVLVTSSIVMAR